MKKLTILLGAALLFASAAQAQVAQVSPTRVTQDNTPIRAGAPAGRGSAAGIGSDGGAAARPAAVQGTDRMVSSIDQVGAGQFADVEQTGVGGNSLQNTASAVQGQVGGVASGQNNATQRQNYVPGFGAMANKLVSTQYGSSSTVEQVQNGNGNRADAKQTNGSSNNSIVQHQGTVGGALSTRDGAYAEQSGSNSSITQAQQNGVGFGGNQAYATQSAGSSNNTASQDQTGTANTAYASQKGSKSSITQTQRGGSFFGIGANAADVEQGTGTNNTAAQNQTGALNQAVINQDYGTNGSNNSASQMQDGLANRAQIFQLSDKNRAVQSQTGSLNEARIGQGPMGDSNFASQVQNGIGNDARTDQFGPRDHSTINQNGNGNVAQALQR